nr:hypothetical protein [Mucilaginibacter sp. FT3.2]
MIPEKPDTDNTGVGMHGLMIVFQHCCLFILGLVSVPVFYGNGNKAFLI